MSSIRLTFKEIARAKRMQSQQIEKVLADEVAKSFFMPKERVQELCRIFKIKEEELMRQLCAPVMKYAMPPISDYSVGCVGRGESGNLYFGVNLEFPQNPLNKAVHAEQCMTVNAFSHGEKKITHIALPVPPCGHCRQFLKETQDSDQILFFIADNDPEALTALLPHSFGPKDLGLESGFLSHKEYHLKGENWTKSTLADEAIKAAEKSYAPISNCPSGVAIEMTDGNIITGSYIENAAFNPSISPLHAALINVYISGYTFKQIKQVLLAEWKYRAIEQYQEARFFMQTIRPGGVPLNQVPLIAEINIHGQVRILQAA